VRPECTPKGSSTRIGLLWSEGRAWVAEQILYDGTDTTRSLSAWEATSCVRDYGSCDASVIFELPSTVIPY
jgi:hypothetical protein